MLGAVARKLFGSANDRLVKTMRGKVDAINAFEPELKKLSDDALAGKTLSFRERLKNGETLDDILPEAFAVVREASVRVLGMRHFDVQMVGGMVLHKGMISEMMTGEGKTLVATLAAYLNAIEGKGVHVVTVNDYLATRDASWMGRLYNFLGLSVGCIIHGLDDDERKAAYGADITYGTNNEFGFDYLRDNMKFSFEQMVQREFNYAIVDEVDSILIDEARTPLIISGPTEDNSELYIRVNAIIPELTDEDSEKDEKTRAITLTDPGVKHVEELLVREGVLTEPANLYDINNISIVHHVNQALRAHKLFTRDVDYIVKDNKVVIIDEFTGRMMEGRRYSEGLHQALEAKERVRIQNENQTLASITFQNYFRLYPKLAGMTGTAMTEANEFRDIYKLQVAEIPTNVDVQRIDHDDEIYRTANEKYKAIISQIAECYKRGQPVLVGTVSIEKSEYLSSKLKDRKYIKEIAKGYGDQVKLLQDEIDKLHDKQEDKKEKIRKDQAELKEMQTYLESISSNETPIPHQVLNARHHEREAYIVGQAGRPFAVTIATNMAGRGTDIKLGGNVEMRVMEELGDMPDGAERQAAIIKIENEVSGAKQDVLAAGGLYVIASERHESRRIDNQLRGRSGRQGDPGASKFFLSLEDDLMRIFGGEQMDGLLQRMGMKEGEAIQHAWMNKAIAKAQQKVEARNYDIRKNLVKFDDVMNDQRKVIYEQRIELIKTEDVSETVLEMREDILHGIVNSHIPAKSYAEQWDTEGLEKELFRLFNLHLPAQEWAKEEGIAEEEIFERAKKAVDAHMQAKEDHFGGELMRLAEKRVLLQTLDQLWKDHLLSLDQLRHGINLRAYGQRDPLNEYKQEAFNLFEHMLNQLRELVITRLSHMEIQVTLPEGMEYRPQPQKMVESREDPAMAEMLRERPYGGKDAILAPIRTHIRPENRDPSDPESWGKVGRNDPCPCGSGKKFKHCHGSIV